MIGLDSYSRQDFNYLDTIFILHAEKLKFEPRHGKTNKVTVRPAKTDQPGHLPSLIRIFAVRMKEAWVLSYPLSA